jgi:hypothetical protein
MCGGKVLFGGFFNCFPAGRGVWTSSTAGRDCFAGMSTPAMLGPGLSVSAGRGYFGAGDRFTAYLFLYDFFLASKSL